MVDLRSDSEDMPLKPTVEEGAIEVEVLGMGATLGLVMAEGGRGGPARSALNSLCAFPMKPFMVKGMVRSWKPAGVERERKERGVTRKHQRSG